VRLGLTRTAFARALQLGQRGYDQVRKWEEGVVPPNAATLTAMRLLVRVQELEREVERLERQWLQPP
jgi:DNA-binding transcriptional regulator YiaG